MNFYFTIFFVFVFAVGSNQLNANQGKRSFDELIKNELENVVQFFNDKLLKQYRSYFVTNRKYK